MDVVMGALPSLQPKLGELLVGEYNLQKGLKGEIMFIQTELESMKGALKDISNIPADQLSNQDKIWARNVRELSYDIEDSIETFMVQGNKGSDLAGPQGFNTFVKRCYNLLTQFQVRRGIAYEIKGIKRRIIQVSERRERYKIDTTVAKPVTIDPRLFARYKDFTELVGIDAARDEVIRMLMEDNEASKRRDKIVSIVGFGGLGKTTLANVVYEKLRAQFDYSAFVSVSQTPDLDKLFKDMLYQISKKSNACINVIEELRELLKKKRYLIVVDDIWDITNWEVIRCVLPNDNIGCKIITTTRILSVAEHAGNAYKQKPLSLQTSQKLLYRRIFGNENIETGEDPETCPDTELAEVSNKIIKKCAGVPLAIITIASLLANKGKNKIVWYEVYNSIGTGMENSLDAENMRKILSYSYYDMPSHLRTCLLYLSTFPEDYVVGKDRLIWLWIAEGFIQPKEQGRSLFNLGENYFNELINRSMIQYVSGEYHIVETGGCRVHDVVLDLIRSISSEENFVTILSNMDYASPSTMVRRLSIQSGKAHVMTEATRSTMPQVRSIIVVPSALDKMPTLGSFKVLRVLDLQGCGLSQGYSLKELGCLFHLRYLSLKYIGIDQLPEEIGNLQFLETLDVAFSGISRLPLTIAQLTHLLCLSVDRKIRVSNRIRRLTSLEELSWLCIDDESIDTIEALGLLTELRVLRICLLTNKWADKLLESLCKLQKIQSIILKGKRNMGGLDVWVAPRQLRSLKTRSFCWFSALPAWMNNHSHLQDLAYLSIAVRELLQEDLEILGRLPALRYLDVLVDHEVLGIIGRFVIDAGSFPCLVRCKLRGFLGLVVFQQGAMPRLTRLISDFHVREAREIVGRDGGFDLGLGNLPSLQKVEVAFQTACASKEDVEDAKAAVCKEAEIHPNKPTLWVLMKS